MEDKKQLSALAIGLLVRSSREHLKEDAVEEADSAFLEAAKAILERGPDVVIAEAKAQLGRTPSARDRAVLRLAIDMAREVKRDPVFAFPGSSPAFEADGEIR